MYRKVILLVMLAVGIMAAGAQSATGFEDIVFGTSPDEARAAMKAKGYVASGQSLDGELLVLRYASVGFSGIIWDSAALSFLRNRFFESALVHYPSAGKAYESFQTLRKVLISKYGTPATDIEQYLSPYKKGDGKVEEALRKKAATIECRWKFRNGVEIYASLQHDPKRNSTVMLFGIYEARIKLEATEYLLSQ
ncbi:MAG: hypothetical protein N2067_06715 [Spirochaetaceae bacterium]|nr:hypothetical protein [Spirochaetaceae bacterium]